MEYFKRKEAVGSAIDAYIECDVANDNAKFDEFESKLKQEGYEIRRIHT